MTRHGASADLDERPSAPDRLRSMQLPPARVGWVPEPVTHTDDAPPPPPPSARLEPVPQPVSAAPAVGDLARGWLVDRAPAWAQGFIERAGVGSVLAALGTLVALVVGATTLLHHHSGSASPPSYDASASAFGASSPSVPSFADPVSSPVASAGSDPTSIVVDVGGRVRKPGLVTLPAGARVADALAAAGGPLHHHEIVALDLAARVADGQLLLIGVKAATGDPAATGAAGGPTPSATAPVPLNSASLEELETLPGIGPVTGQKIIDWRSAHGGFSSVEQLQQVSGIGPATYAELSPLVTV
jgi:competence protein ComEA